MINRHSGLSADTKGSVQGRPKKDHKFVHLEERLALLGNRGIGSACDVFLDEVNEDKTPIGRPK